MFRGVNPSNWRITRWVGINLQRGSSTNEAQRAPVNSKLDINKIMNSVGLEIAPAWYNLAIELFPEDDEYYNFIRDNNQSSIDCLREMLRYLKKNHTADCSLERLIEALNSPVVAHGSAADKLEREFCQQDSLINSRYEISIPTNDPANQLEAFRQEALMWKNQCEKQSALLEKEKERNGYLEENNHELTIQCKIQKEQLDQMQRQLGESERMRAELERKFEPQNSEGAFPSENVESLPTIKKVELSVSIAKVRGYPALSDISIPTLARTDTPSKKKCLVEIVENDSLWEEIAVQLNFPEREIEIIRLCNDDGSRGLAVFTKWKQMDAKANYLKFAQAVFDAHAVKQEPLSKAREAYRKILADACR